MHQQRFDRNSYNPRPWPRSIQLGVSTTAGGTISPIELRYYGVDPEQTAAMYAEALEVILLGMTSKVLNFEGRYYTYHDVPMEMQPF